MKIFIDQLADDYLPVLQAGLQWMRIDKLIKPGDVVFIKPNLTFPHFREGVMTNPACVEALVVALKDYSDRIIIGEADGGGYNPFSIDNVYEKTGLKDLAQRYGVRLVNMSHLPAQILEFHYHKRDIIVPIPQLLTQEIDLLISVPVPKIHMYTYMSMATKNLWGCITRPAFRVKLHPHLEEVLHQIIQHIPKAIAIVDGRYGLNRSGPMRGDVVNLNWLMLADSLLGADAVGCQLMQLDARSVYYLRHIARRQQFSLDVATVASNQSLNQFIAPHPFYLQRHWIDSASTLAFRTPWINHLAFYSPIADLMHKFVYLFREPFYDYEKPENTKLDQ